MRMSLHKEREAAGPLVLGALFLGQGGIATSGACAVCLRSKSHNKGCCLGIHATLKKGPLRWGPMPRPHRNPEGIRDRH